MISVLFFSLFVVCNKVLALLSISKTSDLGLLNALCNNAGVIFSLSSSSISPRTTASLSESSSDATTGSLAPNLRLVRMLPTARRINFKYQVLFTNMLDLPSSSLTPLGFSNFTASIVLAIKPLMMSMLFVFSRICLQQIWVDSEQLSSACYGT